MPKLIQALPEGPVDIIGDVHGELEALLALLGRLGVDVEKKTAPRPLVFVGDLVDRGPDSVGVMEVFRRLYEAGLAFAVAGNHELNILTGEEKEGNGWFFGHKDSAWIDEMKVPFVSRKASESEKSWISEIFRELPLVLVRDDLRVVHACWDEKSAAILPDIGDIAALALHFEHLIDADLEARGVLAQLKAERAEFANLRDVRVKPTRYLHAVAEEALKQQLDNPIKMLTSGGEVALPVEGGPFFTGGKWRFVERDRWWLRSVDRPTVVGHYWRRRVGSTGDILDSWRDVGPFEWAGNGFCVDYSVGKRYVERARGVSEGFFGGLAALRWPERQIVFDGE